MLPNRKYKPIETMQRMPEGNHKLYLGPVLSGSNSPLKCNATISGILFQTIAR
jgi:hypothetical protein